MSRTIERIERIQNLYSQAETEQLYRKQPWQILDELMDRAQADYSVSSSVARDYAKTVLARLKRNHDQTQDPHPKQSETVSA